jgi:hypothetical protein
LMTRARVTHAVPASGKKKRAQNLAPFKCPLR